MLKSAACRPLGRSSSPLSVITLGSPDRDVEIGGDLDGTFDGRSITVLKEASITGQLGADIIDIHGVVHGKVHGRMVRVRPTGRVEGELEYGTLTVDPGATVNARCIPE